LGMVSIGETGFGLRSGYSWNKEEGAPVTSGLPDNKEFDPGYG
jgi:hypothetical protein